MHVEDLCEIGDEIRLDTDYDSSFVERKLVDCTKVNVMCAASLSDYKMEILNKINSVRRKLDAKEVVNSGYVATSLVWGEIRSHPWWPGQIFDPADLSKEALRHYKEGKFLVAYFGNGTFAWNDVTQIRPFHFNFERMQNQSDLDTFCRAVDCALDEVFRRMEFGLTCSCLLENVYADIQSQIVENSGIYKKSRRRNVGDEYSNVECFIPSDLVSYVKEAAMLPKKVINKVEMVKCEAQLTSFCRWKGHRELPEFTYARGLFDINANLTDMVGEDSHTAIVNNTHHLVPPKFSVIEDKGERQDKRRGKPKGTAGKKRKKISHSDNDGLFMPPDHLIVNREPKRKVRLEAPTPENKIGASICKSEKMTSDRFISTRDSFIIPIEGRNVANVLSPDVLLKQLTLTAADPLHDHKYSIPVVKFFSKFKNSICLDYLVSTEPDVSVEKNPIELIDKVIPEYKYRTPHSEHIEDSNSTDQNVKESAANKCFMDSHDESPIVPAEHLAREDLPISKTKFSDPETEDTNSNHDSSKGIPDIQCNQVTGNHKDKMLQTALLLRFSKQGQVPSATDLNKIFSCYGPLHESETKIMKRNLAKVVFKKHCDAEVAFSSTGKYSIFGSSLISYRLKYLTAKPRTVSSQCRKPRKKAAPYDEVNPT